MLKGRNVALVAIALAVVVFVALKLRERPVGPTPGGVSDAAIIDLAQQSVLADARGDALRLCAPMLAPPAQVELIIGLKTGHNSFEVTSARIKDITQVGALDAGPTTDAENCFVAAYRGKKATLTRPPFDVPGDREYELVLDVGLEPPGKGAIHSY
ncbi:MAG: hypothetical protein AB1938_01560 [Myxococcota bacterium]